MCGADTGMGYVGIVKQALQSMAVLLLNNPTVLEQVEESQF